MAKNTHRYKPMTRVVLIGVQPETHEGFGQYARQAGWAVFSHGELPPSPEMLVGPWEVSGLVVGHFGRTPEPGWQKLPVPVVSVGHLPQWVPKIPQILVDADQAARMAADHLIERGFRHLAVLRGNADTGLVNPVRAAFDAAYGSVRSGPTFHCLDWWDSAAARQGWSSRAVRQFVLEAIAPLPRPLAMLMAGHGLPLETVEALLEAGISVPHEVAVMSHHGTDHILDAAPVPISRVELDHHRRGYLAGQLLDTLMQAGKHWQEAAAAEPIVIQPKGILARASTDTTAVSHPKVAQALQRIWEDYGDTDLTASRVAAIVGLSHYGLNKAFHQYMGATIGQVLGQTRLKHAKEMLVRTNQPVKQVAAACGYSNWHTLARALRTETDLSPKRWRKKKRSEVSGLGS